MLFWTYVQTGRSRHGIIAITLLTNPINAHTRVSSSSLKRLYNPCKFNYQFSGEASHWFASNLFTVSMVSMSTQLFKLFLFTHHPANAWRLINDILTTTHFLYPRFRFILQLLSPFSTFSHIIPCASRKRKPFIVTFSTVIFRILYDLSPCIHFAR